MYVCVYVYIYIYIYTHGSFAWCVDSNPAAPAKCSPFVHAGSCMKSSTCRSVPHRTSQRLHVPI